MSQQYMSSHIFGNTGKSEPNRNVNFEFGSPIHKNTFINEKKSPLNSNYTVIREAPPSSNSYEDELNIGEEEIADSQMLSPKNIPSNFQTTNSSNSLIIFGFPPERHQEVVSYFIDKYRATKIEYDPQEKSNWFQIDLSSSFEASNALQLNGKIIGKGMRIGVIPNVKDSTSSSPFSGIRSFESSSEDTNLLFIKNNKLNQFGENTNSIQSLQTNNNNSSDLFKKNDNSIWSKLSEYVFGF